MLVQIEGTDRVGKTTVSNELARLLERKGLKVKVIPFPNRKTDIGGIINKMLQLPKFDWNDAVVFQLLQTANRLEFYNEILEWEPKSDAILIFDRYVLSGLVYGKLDNVPYKFLLQLQLLLPPPQLTVILQADEESLKRRLAEKKNKEIYESLQHALRVQNAYVPIAREYLEMAEEKYKKNLSLLVVDNSDDKLNEAVETIYFTITQLLRDLTLPSK
ncbi:MAG: dTMP kinase [Candidatus Asgardarchaeia archaeon]|nr:dTMP kinase [Candidatus Odinarchaeota archaeon]